jgi:predicted MPP superfamily phosphohydrolase
VIPRILAIGALWTAIWWSIVGAFVAPVVPGGWLTILAAMMLAYTPLVVLVQRFHGAYPSAVVRLWLFRPFWYLQLTTLLSALTGAGAFLLAAPFGFAMLAGRWTVVTVASAFALFALAGYLGSRQLHVRRLEAWYPDLPDALEGLRIAQVSDLHVGPHTPSRHMAQVRHAVQAAEPDIIAITGDQVDDYPGDVDYFARAFSGWSAPHGVFAIAGNHDIYAGWPAVRAGLEAMGLTVLLNDAVEIRHGNGRLWLAGTGDPAGNGPGPVRNPGAAPDIARTLAPIPPGAFIVAMAHNPQLWPALAQRGVQLTLSGHTHYGQLAIPFLNWSLASVFLEHAMGWYQRGGSLLYINPGTNYWGLPLRVGTLPEVTVLTLRRHHDPQHAASIVPEPR